MLIAKLLAYGFDISSLNLLQDYFSNRKQITEVDSFFSSKEDILYGVPQGSILGPLLFSIFMCDMFLILKTVYFTGYADDNIPFAVPDNINDIIWSLEEVGENLIAWFFNNQLKLNPDKCHLLLNPKEQATLKKSNLHIKNSLWEKLLGINFDYMVNFAKHIEDIYQKASSKLNALARLTPYMTPSKICIPMNAFFKSQFDYCPFIWICCNRSLNNKINR